VKAGTQTYSTALET